MIITQHQVIYPSCTVQEVDAAALLRLYLNYDLLEAAAELVMEYVDALLGKGHQYFGIEVHLPYYRHCCFLCDGVCSAGNEH